MADGDELLEARSLAVHFGGVRAVDGVDLVVRRGQLVGLIGPNGAGKTTTIDALTGFVSHTGQVVFAGDDLSGLPAHERTRRGLGRTWQAGELFDDLTLLENCRVASEPQGLTTAAADVVRPDRPWDDGAALEALELLDLAADAHRYPTELSLGARKLAGVARALAGRPQLVLLDEPAAGLDTAESHRLGERLRAIVDAERSCLLVDHDMGLVMSVCDHVYVLEFGRIIAHGPPEAIRSDAKVIAAYLGEDVAVAEPAT